MKQLWRSSKKDFSAWAGCLLICLCAGVEMGLLFGILLNMTFVLLRLAKPKLLVTLENVNLLYYNSSPFIPIL